MKKNPGLRSRIAHHVPFDDYSTEELCEIAELLSKKMGFSLTEEATERLSGILERARKDPEFGNGRYVRNILEKARKTQASRLLGMSPDKVDKKTVATICVEDITEPAELRKGQGRIGFC